MPDTRPHDGHDMPGMVSLDTLGRAKRATGREFERILTDSLSAHFTQSRTLCASEQDSGGANEAKDLAAVIEGSVTEELARLGPTYRLGTPHRLPAPHTASALTPHRSPPDRHPTLPRRSCDGGAGWGAGQRPYVRGSPPSSPRTVPR
ncbi:DUF305 domain-containing protein [Streptomyces sp. NBC_00233]|nr:DUF305 domain-containing protein [Streptomyces sp. NBC_00233]